MIKIMTNIKQLILTLVALFAMTTGAWADETVFELNGSEATTGTLTLGTNSVEATTVKIHTNTDNVAGIKFSSNYSLVDGKYFTIAPATGSFKAGDKLTIAVCFNNADDTKTAKAVIYAADGETLLYTTDQGINGRTMNDNPKVEEYVLTQDAEKLYFGRNGNTATFVTMLKVLRTASAPAGIDLTPDATRKVWTLDKMPAGNVELQVEYYPGMLVKPTNLVGGTMEIEGLTDTTLPEGFEKDDDGNIYVAKDTKFTVKAVPAEGYHLVGWSDDATNKELEREFTMGDDDFILTATFSDEYDLAFEALNANTIEAGKATVTVGGTAATVTEGKLSGVKYGQTVTIKAKNGYKFKKVEVKKSGSAVLAPALENGATVVIICNWGYATTTFTYTNNGGTFSGQASGYDAGYFYNGLELNGKNLSFGASNMDNSEFLSVGITFNTESSAYSYTGKGEDFVSFTISVNGTDVTDQLSELK